MIKHKVRTRSSGPHSSNRLNTQKQRLKNGLMMNAIRLMGNLVQP